MCKTGQHAHEGAEEGLGQTIQLLSLSFFLFLSCRLKLGPGCPPGVWVCSTDMLLSVPPNPGESERAWDHLPSPQLGQALPF